MQGHRDSRLYLCFETRLATPMSDTTLPNRPISPIAADPDCNTIKKSAHLHGAQGAHGDASGDTG